jgi:hypothetical protein
MEIGWLIEKRTSTPEWWTGDNWSTDAGIGLRFARKIDAENIIKKEKLFYCSVPIKATEHEWINEAYLPIDDYNMLIHVIDCLPNYIIELPGMEDVMKIFNQILENRKDDE